MATTTYEMEAMIRGYHVYAISASVWDAQIGEELLLNTWMYVHSNFVK